ncbi:uncharacterized protein Dana_GF27811 [Drosophila ananassae]|uniref:Uncharacterized protein n=1 Tax=Drosophila ananassae TaxID=7217 RepID=A0A0N8NZX7_DROAN|nr:uncharacterized protein LOC26515220 [Drosophila ananassae]KPU75556.1 uncharacterized protein Dana_GF27811 [Drosophila ananassae]
MSDETVEGNDNSWFFGAAHFNVACSMLQCCGNNTEAKVDVTIPMVTSFLLLKKSREEITEDIAISSSGDCVISNCSCCFGDLAGPGPSLEIHQILESNSCRTCSSFSLPVAIAQLLV